METFHITYPFFDKNLSVEEILGLIDKIFSRISNELNDYYGIMFERLILELIKTKTIEFPFNFDRVVKWWYKDKEIDIVALNSETNETVFVECKWQENVDVKKILNELKEKSKFVK